MSTHDIRIKIANDERSLENADAQWVHQSIRAREAEGQAPCVRVTIRTAGLNLLLVTHACSSAGFGRAPNREEAEIVKLWNHFGLSEPGANLRQVWPFLSRLRSLLGLRAA